MYNIIQAQCESLPNIHAMIQHMVYQLLEFVVMISVMRILLIWSILCNIYGVLCNLVYNVDF